MSRMAKARKSLSKQNSSVKSVFIPEAVVETDGKTLRHLRKADVARSCVYLGLDSASKDSARLKRKSMSVNAESHKPTLFGVCVDGVSCVLPTMSNQERRKHRKKLKWVLEQVLEISARLEARIFQLRGPAGSAVGHACNRSHLSRIEGDAFAEKEVTSVPSRKFDTSRSYGGNQIAGSNVVMADGNFSTPVLGKEKRTPKANQMYLNPEYLSGKQKMPLHDKGKLNLGVKRPLQAKVISDSKRLKLEQVHSKRLGDVMKQCATLLRKLMTHKHGWVFNEPVDAVKLGLPDYHKIIRFPMDFGTIKNKLSFGEYKLASEFANDVRLTFANAMKYNPVGHDVHIMADVLRLIFEEKWKCIIEKITEPEKITEVPVGVIDVQVNAQELLYFRPEAEGVKEQPEAERAKEQQASSSKSRSAVEREKGNAFSNREMTFDEKKLLTDKIQHLPGDVMEEVIYMLRRSNPNLVQDGLDIEVDLDSIDWKTLWELDRFLTQHENNKGTNNKAMLKVQQLQNEDKIAAKASYSQTRGYEGELVNESVEVGDQVSSPLHRDDSDSGIGSLSASDSEAGDAQAAHTSVRLLPEKEIEQPMIPSDQDHGPPTSGVFADAENVGAQSGYVDDHLVASDDILVESKEALTARQLSPDKLLRAALLKGRFADTILKAKEKTLPLSKNSKADPEKLKKEREELEKRQRQERARLQAEAKAAELARKKAEADAALEARRKREEEREAARRALQQMERTVEFNQEIELSKDLEIFTNARLEQLSSSGGEVSPASSPEGLSTFGFQPGNPLEQLGLFMKDDYDDDYEKQGDGEVADAEMTVEGGDVEEGEID